MRTLHAPWRWLLALVAIVATGYVASHATPGLLLATSFVVGTGDYIRPYRKTQVRHFREAASQTFILGDVLILQTSADKGNQVKISGADPATNTVVGIALEAASGVENTLVAVAPLDEIGEFLIAIGSTQSLDADDIGDLYGIVADATNLIWRLDNTETTATVFRVVDFAPGYAHGDVNGKYIVKAANGRQAVFVS
jgi:hypothetical protein